MKLSRVGIALASLAISAGFLFPIAASAAVIYQQTSSSTTMDFQSGAAYVQSFITSSAASSNGFFSACFPATGQTLGNLSFYLASVSGSFQVLVNTYSAAACGGSNLISTSTTLQSVTSNAVNVFNLSSLALTPTGSQSFSLVVNGNTSCGGGFCNYQTKGDGTYTYFILDDGVVPDFSTHISTVSPANGATVATSSAQAITITGYLASSDYIASSTRLHVQFFNAATQVAQVASVGGIFNSLYGSFFHSATQTPVNRTFDFVATSSGAFSFSTTTPLLQEGLYKIVADVQNPPTGFFSLFTGGSWQSLAATSTVFTAATSSALDRLVESETGAFATSSSALLSSCSPTTWNTLTCITVLFVPDPGQVTAALTDFKNTFLTYMPWGYVTRFVTILSGDSTSTIPDIAIPTPLGNPSSPGFIDGSFHFSAGEMLTGGAAAFNGVHTTFGGDVSARDVFEPFVILSIVMSMVLYIIKDLLGMANARAIHRKGALH